ncbi:MAG: hypothetical protein V8Q54_02505 [Alistipes senegalensis]
MLKKTVLSLFCCGLLAGTLGAFPAAAASKKKEKGEIRTSGSRAEKDERIREALQGEARDGRRHDPPAQGQG